MMANRNPVQDALARFATELGLASHSKRWYYQHGREVTSVLDLQKSQYGLSYYVNLGFWIDKLGKKQLPKPEDTHVHVRLETLLHDERERIGRLLDLETPIDDVTRVNELVEMFRQQLQPLLIRGQTIEGLAAMFEDGTLASAAVVVDARRVLGLSAP